MRPGPYPIGLCPFTAYCVEMYIFKADRSITVFHCVAYDVVVWRSMARFSYSLCLSPPE